MNLNIKAMEIQSIIHSIRDSALKTCLLNYFGFINMHYVAGMILFFINVLYNIHLFLIKTDSFTILFSNCH